jgi:hypothetical protein
MKPNCIKFRRRNHKSLWAAIDVLKEHGIKMHADMEALVEQTDAEREEFLNALEEVHNDLEKKHKAHDKVHDILSRYRPGRVK